jgi:glycine/D-amino acid oxidase-like deaminating enzyme
VPQEYEQYEYDVLVIGAGGAGLRAAIEAAAQGVSVSVVCKSPLGKAHTVMAEGGIAAALGNVWPEDNWRVHFRDTMRGGRMLSNWRMAELHAQEAPERVLELERWGALFDRTQHGRILQRDFGGHRYARLAHVGDRTGLEMIRTLQDHVIGEGIDVHMECTIARLLKDGERICGAFGYWRNTGRFVLFKARAVVLATGGIGKAWEITTNSSEYTGDGHALALWAGADLIDMEFVQFHPTGMVWPPSVRGILVTEGVRGDGGTLRNNRGERFMFNYIPEFYKAETADNEAEADRWYADKRNNRRTPDLLPRDEVVRAMNAEMIQTLTPDRADEPLREGILPRAVRRREDFLDPHALHSAAKLLAVSTFPLPRSISHARDKTVTADLPDGPSRRSRRFVSSRSSPSRSRAIAVVSSTVPATPYRWPRRRGKPTARIRHDTGRPLQAGSRLASAGWRWRGVHRGAGEVPRTLSSRQEVAVVPRLAPIQERRIVAPARHGSKLANGPNDPGLSSHRYPAQPGTKPSGSVSASSSPRTPVFTPRSGDRSTESRAPRA